jgi:hypothetical protein
MKGRRGFKLKKKLKKPLIDIKRHKRKERLKMNPRS